MTARSARARCPPREMPPREMPPARNARAISMVKKEVVGDARMLARPRTDAAGQLWKKGGRDVEFSMFD